MVFPVPPLHFLLPFPSFLLFLSSPSFPFPLPSPSLPPRSGPLQPARGLGERCELPQRPGPGGAPLPNGFPAFMELKSGSPDVTIHN
jgi:hypothetical protein